MTHGAFDLFVSGVTDEEYVVVLPRETHRLSVHFGHQRAGGVNRVEGAVSGRLDHHRGDSVSTEDNGGALRDFLHLVDEDDTVGFEFSHHVDVVNNLLAHIDGSAVAFESFLDRDDGPVDTGAVPTRGREQNSLLSVGRDVHELLPTNRNDGVLETSACFTVAHCHKP